MAEPAKTYTQDETIGLIRAKSQDTQHGDSFTVKISRRVGAIAGYGGGSELLVTMGQASIQHISSPEAWLSKLAGGGSYVIKVFSEADPGKQIGGDLLLRITGEPKSINPSIVKDPSWRGPPEMLYPEPGSLQLQQPFMTIAAGPSGNNFVPQPPAPAQLAPSAPSLAELQLQRQLEQTQAMLQQMQSELTNRSTALAEERAARERERMQQSHTVQMQALEAKIDRLATAAPAKSPVESLTAIASTLMPLVQAMIQSNAETRALMLKAQQDNQTQLQALMLKSMERPPIDPAVTQMMDRFQAQLEKLRESDPAQHSAISSMADAFGGMTSMMMNVLNQAVDSGILGGKGESTGMMVVKEIAKAIESFGRASAGAGARRTIFRPPAPPALPPRPAPAPTPAPMNGSTNGASGFAGVSAPASPLDAIERRIRAEEDPETVAADFIAAMSHAAVQAEITQAGGITELFQNRLGDWANDHVEYAQALLAAVEAHARAAGIIVDAEATAEEG